MLLAVVISISNSKNGLPSNISRHHHLTTSTITPYQSTPLQSLQSLDPDITTIPIRQQWTLTPTTIQTTITTTRLSFWRHATVFEANTPTSPIITLQFVLQHNFRIVISSGPGFFCYYQQLQRTNKRHNLLEGRNSTFFSPTLAPLLN